ncbi:MAG: 4Fe-4S dicluster domain-containing protein [Dehalococcoidia bacterium]|nr:4Fe-4S dicluster domain-containing protein [Dehalococcoidia bacterium]
MMSGLSGPMAANRPQLDRIRGVEGLNAELCFSCRKCSAGCPVADDMDLAPHQLVRLAVAGPEGEALRSSGIWLCTSCQTCTTRCPNGVDVAGVIDALKQRAVASGVKPRDGRMLAFHRAFLDDVKARGRVHEMSLTARYALRARRVPEGILLGIGMFQKGKLPLIPPKKTATRELRRLFERGKGK